MTPLELLAPARNKDIGVAAIDCGADAVYIAGPEFGARKAAGNDVGDIAELCSYAHRYGARVFVTFNTIIYDEERERAHIQMLQAQEAGADAFIIRDAGISAWEDITVPLHASTQCAIRDVGTAQYYESIGCSRIILERELSLETIKEICSCVSCEVEFFVHGALCVCYSGDCRLSEYLDGRSADRGECIQACRSLYDLVDASGKVLVHNKALLSLKDYNLKNRLEDLALAGVSSFKIEGRLKSESYVKNIVRDYSLALDRLIAQYPDRYCRASFGKVSGGFVPDAEKTFNRGYTELYLDGKRGLWSSMDAPTSMGEVVGTVESLRTKDGTACEFRVSPFKPGLVLNNGDGFSFATKNGIKGFRGDSCNGTSVSCKAVPGLKEGIVLHRNMDSAFEKKLETMKCKRELQVNLEVTVYDGYEISISATSEDGRQVECSFRPGNQKAVNPQRAASMLKEQLSKRYEHYHFNVSGFSVNSSDGSLPLLSASSINAMRRETGESINRLPCSKHRLMTARKNFLAKDMKEMGAELMRTRYCIKYELGLCPVRQGAEDCGPLFLLNNGRRLSLGFDCRNCEMTVTPCGALSPSRVFTPSGK